MIDALGPGTLLGYCTNVHPGATLDAVMANLDRHAVPVKRQVSPDAPMAVGLWLGRDTARQLLERDRVAELRSFLNDRGLIVESLNGFPYGDFHQPVIKHAVYEPDWTTDPRSAYTLDLATILADLLPEGAEGSISTVPIGWPSGDPDIDRHRLDAAGNRLLDLVHRLARLELDTGRLIHVDLEPEPGCLLDTADDLIGFFQGHLLGGLDDASVLAYLRVCHDICHAAVMFEPQARALAAYRSAGIAVGKVQLSSALAVDFDTQDTVRRAAALAELHRFAEDRYLHQVGIRLADGTHHLIEDLPAALDQPAAGCWRIHFHVPLFARTLGPLGTTADQVSDSLTRLTGTGTRHFEVETYAWSVLPEAHRPGNLADGIARELQWVLSQAEAAA